VYDKVAEYLMLIGRTELLTCSATQTSFTRIRDQAQQVGGVHQFLLISLLYTISVHSTVSILCVAADTGVQLAVFVPVLSCAQTTHPL
jgi:hypothetical protein